MHTLTTVRYGQGPTPFGFGIIGWTDQGIVMLHLQQTAHPQPQDVLASDFPDCTLARDDKEAKAYLEQVFHIDKSGHSQPRLTLAMSGSPFQLKVWQALRDIPFGQVRSYGALAESVGHPGAARAVGTAIAANQLAYLVPCHRVVRATGETGQFRWGAALKVQMLAWEAHQLAVSNADR